MTTTADSSLGWGERGKTAVRNHPGDRILTATSDTRPRSNRLPRHERRRQLLDAALEVFVSQGYHAAAPWNWCVQKPYPMLSGDSALMEAPPGSVTVSVLYLPILN